MLTWSSIILLFHISFRPKLACPIKSCDYQTFLWIKSADTFDFTDISKFSLIISLSGEFLAANAGLGYLIIYGSQVFKLDWVTMSIIILCFLATGLYKLIDILFRKYV